MAKDFLLEIGIEEMPAKFAPGVVRQLRDHAAVKLAEYRLAYEELRVYVTPRRLALLVEGLAAAQEDMSEEVKGPAQKAAFDEEGRPTRAALGFAKGQGVETKDLYLRELKGVVYVYARKFVKGARTSDLLPDFCREMIAGLRFPKPMRWGALEIRFARPIRWLVALYGGDVVPFSYAGLTAGRVTKGHRLLGGEAALAEADDYLAELRRVYVLADQNERQAVIWRQIEEEARRVGGEAEADEALLEEITHLLEYPTALAGRIEDAYMILPEEVVITPMKEHQRYFPVRSVDKKLLPYFITVRNGGEQALAVVQAGNEKVLRARLEDAAFYYREDLKKPLAALVPQLARVTYHEKLGSVAQRVERLRRLAGALAETLALSEAETALVDRTAFLAKADLITRMVYDFPELQGIMGAYYARSSGEPEQVCLGIKEHYQPRFAGDALPSTLTGSLVSVADKVDAIVGSFAIGLQPTGSQDPYALRRQALGVTAMLMAEKRDLSLVWILKNAYDALLSQGLDIQPWESIESPLLDFFAQRLKYLLQEEGLRYDVVDSVLAQGAEKPYAAHAKAQKLAEKRREEGFEAYTNAYVRCVNLSKKSEKGLGNAALLTDEAEKNIIAVLAEVGPQVWQAERENDFQRAYALAGQLIQPIETLFERVMIMVEEEELRQARLGLLRDCAKILGVLGDLSCLAS